MTGVTTGIARSEMEEIATRPASGAAADPPAIPPEERRADDHEREVVIRPSTGWQVVDWGELWRYRDLLYFLTLRDITIRYKQTVLGVGWAVIRPVMTAGVFTVLFAALFGKGRLPSIPGVPYFVSTLAAMLPWQLFAGSMSGAGNSLVKHQRLITKVYFPRLIAPLSSSLAGLADFGVAFVVLIAAMLWNGLPIPLTALAVPLLVLLALAASLAVGLWLSALNAIYRDVSHVLPFLTQMGMFATPILYSTDRVRGAVPGWAFQLYCLNPMVGVVEGFRWALFGKTELQLLPLVISVLVTVVLLISGAMYFRRMERTFADVV